MDDKVWEEAFSICAGAPLLLFWPPAHVLKICSARSIGCVICKTLRVRVMIITLPQFIDLIGQLLAGHSILGRTFRAQCDGKARSALVMQPCNLVFIWAPRCCRFAIGCILKTCSRCHGIINKDIEAVGPLVSRLRVGRVKFSPIFSRCLAGNTRFLSPRRTSRRQRLLGRSLSHLVSSYTEKLSSRHFPICVAKTRKRLTAGRRCEHLQCRSC